jgi:hypothetical protein
MTARTTASSARLVTATVSHTGVVEPDLKVPLRADRCGPFGRRVQDGFDVDRAKSCAR